MPGAPANLHSELVLHRSSIRLLLVLCGTSALLLAPGLARADDGGHDEDEARVTARCTGGAKAELRVRSHDEGQLRVEITLRNRNSARPWTVVVIHERRLAYRGRLERGRGTVRLTIADLPGRDAVVIRARGAAREACSAAAAVFGG